MKSIRKELHAHPEISGCEERTALKIADLLKEIGVHEVHSNFSQHSVLGVIDGKKQGKTTLFRCELDALPIKETNTFDHHSKNSGVAHKCGHDGHMTILLALAEQLVNEPPEKGKFLLLFQSAEETGEGAQNVIESGFLNSFSIDHVIALHNVPGFEKNAIICKKNEFTPSVESFEIQLKGETSHAGEPDKGKNPATCLSEIIHYMQSLHQPDPKKENYFVVAPIHINMGDRAYGTSAGDANIGYTVRTFNHAEFDQQKKRIEEKTKSIAKGQCLDYDITWKEAFAANQNDKKVVETIEETAIELNLKYIEKKNPFDWGEDFGLFTQRYPGAMFGLGSGTDTPPLHDSSYDFPDDIIDTGKDMFYTIANKLQQ